MKKTKKRALGFIGLIAVAVFTLFAAFIPNPAATAMTSGVNDTVLLRVASSTPNINITSPTNSTIFTIPYQVIAYDYDHIDTVEFTLVYTDENGVTTTYPLGSTTPSVTPSGSDSYNLDLLTYGYGDFVFKIKGTNSSTGVTDEDIVAFSYYPVTGTAQQIQNSGDIKIDLNYNENNPNIDHIKINIYDQNNNLVTSLSPVIVSSPNKTTTISFANHNLPAGDYTFEFIAFDSAGTQASFPYKTSLYYNVGSPEDPVVAPVSPNTGGFLGLSSISKADGLIASLLVFFTATLLGLFFIIKNHQKPKTRRAVR